ncbi:MAG: cobalamin B12-binding domain-containing protein [bacterium]|nr:cobalamin B12-binding domain-containing protein [bacterium]
MGILYIAAELRRAGVEAGVIDADIEGLTVKETADRTIAMEPDLVGFPVMTPQLPATLEACFWLKELAPEIPIVIGGGRTSARPTPISSCSVNISTSPFPVRAS